MISQAVSAETCSYPAATGGATSRQATDAGPDNVQHGSFGIKPLIPNGLGSCDGPGWLP